MKRHTAPYLRPAEIGAEARRRIQAILATTGSDVRVSRRSRHLTQAGLGRLVDLSQAAISEIERGRHVRVSLETLERLSVALDRPLHVGFDRDVLPGPADAGHLSIQELVLRLARRAGFEGSFELATRPSDPARSADVGLRDDRHRLLVLVECWNTIGDVGAAARSTSRKVAEAAQLGVVVGGSDGGYEVGSCWVVRATHANRLLVARYPEVFARRFPGSSRLWTEALTRGGGPPAEPGLVWADVAGTRLFHWRRG